MRCSQAAKVLLCRFVARFIVVCRELEKERAGLQRRHAFFRQLVTLAGQSESLINGITSWLSCTDVNGSDDRNDAEIVFGRVVDKLPSLLSEARSLFPPLFPMPPSPAPIDSATVLTLSTDTQAKTDETKSGPIGQKFAGCILLADVRAVLKAILPCDLGTHVDNLAMDDLAMFRGQRQKRDDASEEKHNKQPADLDAGISGIIFPRLRA